jgi:hypothetical protein
MSCKGAFHASCVKVSAGSLQAISFECPLCVLVKMDPLNDLIETILPPTVLSGAGVLASLEVSGELYNKLGKKNHLVELRCLRLDGSKNMYETTWPDSAECSLNGHTLKEFTPLQ